jgi:hypothetical protein
MSSLIDNILTVAEVMQLLGRWLCNLFMVVRITFELLTHKAAM